MDTRAHACTHMHAHVHTQSSSSSTQFLCLTMRVLYLLAIQAYLVWFHTVVFWVLVVNSSNSESPAKEGGWPRALSLFKPKFFLDSTDAGPGLQGSGPASRQQPNLAGEAGAWSGGCKPPFCRPRPPRESAFCHSAGAC